MDDSIVIAALHTMRTGPAYQNAELLRRRAKASGKSVAAMATSGEVSEDCGAIMLLIGTWEAIALMLAKVTDKSEKDSIFAITPASYMWHELSPAVKIFRTSSCGFAQHFEKIAADHKAWLKEFSKNAEYETDDCHFCMHALFG